MRKKPPILATSVPLLEQLLDLLLGILALRDLLERVIGDHTLESFELERVASGHQVIVVDQFDEWLDLAALLLTSLGHSSRDLARVSLNAGDQCMREGMGLGAAVQGLDDHDLQSDTPLLVAKDEARLPLRLRTFLPA